jgi:hypothetical protein
LARNATEREKGRKGEKEKWRRGEGVKGRFSGRLLKTVISQETCHAKN